MGEAASPRGPNYLRTARTGKSLIEIRRPGRFRRGRRVAPGRYRTPVPHRSLPRCFLEYIFEVAPPEVVTGRKHHVPLITSAYVYDHYGGALPVLCRDSAVNVATQCAAIVTSPSRTRSRNAQTCDAARGPGAHAVDMSSKPLPGTKAGASCGR